MTEAASVLACAGVARPVFRTFAATVFTREEVLGETDPRPVGL